MCLCVWVSVRTTLCPVNIGLTGSGSITGSVSIMVGGGGCGESCVMISMPIIAPTISMLQIKGRYFFMVSP